MEEYVARRGRTGMDEAFFEVLAVQPLMGRVLGIEVLTIGSVASLIPALRATRVDPVHIIREE